MAYTNLPAYTAQTVSYVLLGYEDLVEFNATSGNLTATMPSAAVVAVGKLFTITKIDSSTNTVTVNSVSSQTFSAIRPSITLRSQGDTVTVKSDGANWQIVNKRETEQMSSSATAATNATITSGTYAGSGSCASVTLTPGTWRVAADFCYISGNANASNALQIQQNSGLYGATGTGTTTPPSALSTVATVVGQVTLGFSGSNYNTGATSSTVQGINLVAFVPAVLVTVTTNTTIYAVPQVEATGTGANNQLSAQIYAERVL